ncbi:76R [Yaba monkey tumor virus]|uniref:76R n=1 Tax=Yaba monkey tumor virus (strain VR587) TaxID=928314 RepID=Q6TUT9_YMTV5|nr:late transcription factor VLTF-4 [Yaba monkey tumor virus]AAR07432.1 76R [Yaba monkey tumor virus]
MSWSINLGNGGDNFKTLDEIRAHVKSTTESVDEVTEEIFPSDIEIPSQKTPIKKRAVTRKKQTTVSKPKCSGKEKLIKPESDNEKTEENEKSKENLSKNTNSDEDINDSDLKIATDKIIKDLKVLNSRISAISTVLEDVQASSVSRQFTSLGKSVDVLKATIESGKTKVTRKKPRHDLKK